MFYDFGAIFLSRLIFFIDSLASFSGIFDKFYRNALMFHGLGEFVIVGQVAAIFITIFSVSFADSMVLLILFHEFY